ncbi:putative sulfate/molybdate transporter [Shewanella sp. C32]|uniref:Sulfate/molybdate transporter n=1 Tax=Shewanella electrica TaxID=515560 RepID=A0ABT2FQD1_9GAMM|nr:putative sulfate/molybdate transporter [Shewanella electrica]MCH1925730.1 putative sulfate/molybdate transporter [Shewanella electrica]MCS4558443.1 putative sulfate/molybdate transporter [Shewanella electrica]
MTQAANSAPASRQFLAELTGAFADLGTFLPLVLGLIALNQFSPQGIFLGFGLFCIAVALFYRRPIPVQPMKVISALVIAQGLSPGMMQASAMLMGLILLALAFSGAIEWLARQVSQAIATGIQFAIGLQLLWIGAKMMSVSPWIGFGAFAIIFLSRFLPWHYLAMPLVLVGGMAWQYSHGSDASFTFNDTPWQLGWPVLGEWQSALTLLVLPQLALTLTNAVIASSMIAREKFPDDAAKFTPKAFATSSGLANLLLAPLGAMSMCHGAGGLVAQYHFGARRLWAPLIFGGFCLLVALCWGENVAWLLSLIPMAVLGSLLSTAGLQLAWSRRLLDGRPFCMLVIAITASISLFVNAAAGLAAGLILEFLRRRWHIVASLR